jgi:hypothetical protein
VVFDSLVDYYAKYFLSKLRVQPGFIVALAYGWAMAMAPKAQVGTMSK